MAIVRVVGFDPATGKEHRLTTGDTIENYSGVFAGVNFKGAIPDVGSFPAEVGRVVGDMWTVTAVAAIVDPEGTGQTLQPGDEVVWDGTQWVVIGNASLPNVEAALITVLAADEDMLIRIGGALGALNVGAIGNFLQVIDGGGAVPQVSWGAAPAAGWTPPTSVVDVSAAPPPVAISPADVNKVILVGGAPFAVVLPDPTALPVGTEIHFRHPSAIIIGAGPPGPPSWPLDFFIDPLGGTLEGVVDGGPGLPFQYRAQATSYGGGVTVRVTEPDGGGGHDWKFVSDWAVEPAGIIED